MSWQALNRPDWLENFDDDDTIDVEIKVTGMSGSLLFPVVMRCISCSELTEFFVRSDEDFTLPACECGGESWAGPFMPGIEGAHV